MKRPSSVFVGLGLPLAVTVACAPAASDPSTPEAGGVGEPSSPVTDRVIAAPSAEAPSDPDAGETSGSVHSSASSNGPHEKPRVAVPANSYRLASGVTAPVRAFVEARQDAGHPGTLWAGPLMGNGGRDVLIYVPPTVEAEAPVRLVFHFHGTYSEHLEPEAPGVKKKKWVGWNRLEQTLEAADALAMERPKNVVVVYPLSAGRRIEPEWVGWANKQYDRLWMKAQGESFAELHAGVVEVLEDELGVPPAALDDDLVVEGHSAGGIALWHIAAGGPGRGADLVSEFLFLDAGFQDWADGCFEAIERHDLDARLSMVITDGGIADPWGGRTPWCTQAPENAKRWPSVQAECEPLLETRPSQKPEGGDVSCRQLAADAAQWPRQSRWCEDMKTDMSSVPRVYVHRTKVAHGKQIAHFFGGLELPADWWGEMLASPP